MKWSFACVSLHGRKSMEAIKENWTTIKEAVRREYSLSDISYHTWVEPLEFHYEISHKQVVGSAIHSQLYCQ